jgi:catechol-2,3-dioxygenase
VKCTRLGFQIGPGDDLDAFERQTQGHTERKRDASPTITDMVSFQDPKGTVMEVFKQPEPLNRKFQRKGVLPQKLGHVAFHVVDAKLVTQFYCDVLGFRISDWMGDFFSFLRCGVEAAEARIVDWIRNKEVTSSFSRKDI